MVSPAILTTTAGGVRDFWAFYRHYTDTTVHTAATAALTIFGLLTFVDPWFAVVAIACYVVPPLALYALADEPRLKDEGGSNDADRIGESVAPPSPRERAGLEGGTAANGDGGAEFDRDDRGGDGGSDGGAGPDAAVADGDTDSDTDDGDTDTDSDDGDTDSDSDNDNGDTDSDSDSDDGDTDSDSDSDG